MGFNLGKLVFQIDEASIMQIGANVQEAMNNGNQGAIEGMDTVVAAIGMECDLYVPRYSGTLAHSQYRLPATDKGNSIEAELGYGGPNDQVNPRTGKAASTYMVYVHEDLTKPHATGSAKFLEGPVRAAEFLFLNTLGLHISAALTKKVG